MSDFVAEGLSLIRISEVIDEIISSEDSICSGEYLAKVIAEKDGYDEGEVVALLYFLIAIGKLVEEEGVVRYLTPEEERKRNLWYMTGCKDKLEFIMKKYDEKMKAAILRKEYDVVEVNMIVWELLHEINETIPEEFVQEVCIRVIQRLKEQVDELGREIFGKGVSDDSE